MSSCSKIVTWNANGLLQHRDEFENFLIINNIDVALISETHLRPNQTIRLRGYTVYSTPHPGDRARGGAAVIVKTSISQHMLQPWSTTGVQTARVQLNFHSRKITMTAIYCSPNHSVDRSTFHSILTAAGPSSIVGGDFNAKHTFWASRITTPRGRVLLSAIQGMKANILSTHTPTHWPADSRKKPDVLDFFVLRGIPLQKTEIVTLKDLSSDHLPVLFTLFKSASQKPGRKSLTSAQTKWDIYQDYINEAINLHIPLKSEADLNHEVEKLTTILQAAAAAATPPQKKKLDHPDFPQLIRDLVLEKRKARHRWQQTRSPADKTKFNRLVRKLKASLAEHRHNSFASYAAELSPTKSNEKSLWRALKVVNHPRQFDSPLCSKQGNWTTNAAEKANVLADHLEDVFKPNPVEGTPFSPPLDYKHEHIQLLVSPLQVAREIDNLKTKKAPGCDNIKPIMLKQLPKKGIVLLCYLYNAALRLRYFPTQWKKAQVIVLPKPGKPPHDPASYRPISLLPIMGKVFEKLIQAHIDPILSKRGAIPAHQFGFRRKHSTIEQVHHVAKIIRNTLESKRFCATAFLDIANAFDKVWLQGLISKLRQSLPANLANLLESFLTNRCYRVYHDGEFSPWHPMVAGVPQGSVLSPTLFLIYAADAPTTIGTTMAMFADDTAILATANSYPDANDKLQLSLNALNKWTKKWRIQINPSKSKNVVFTLRKFSYAPVKLNGTIIPLHQSAKYLGITLDAKLNWSEHISAKKAQSSEKLRSLYWILNKNSPVNLETKRLIYMTIVKPIWTYGLIIWGTASKSNLQKIIRSENKVLRTMVGAYRYERNCDIRKDLNIPSFEDLTKSFATRYKKRIDVHQNPIAARLYHPSHTIKRLKRNSFNSLLT